jgi:outer membrane protein
MKTLRESLAMICLALTVSATSGQAQQAPSFKNSFDKNTYWMTKYYRPLEFDSVRLGNSNRLEQLLRAGKLYLSLSDAIALTLENNIDIEIQRYGPELARVDYRRAEAGGQIRGVSTQVTQGAQSAVNLVTGGFGAAGGGAGGAGGGAGNAGSNTGTVFTVTGSSIPNLDPILTTSYFHSKNSNPQTNSFVTGISALVISSDSFNTVHTAARRSPRTRRTTTSTRSPAPTCR